MIRRDLQFFNDLFKALAIDEKIGYPEFLNSRNTSQLEQMYREVGKDLLRLSRAISIDF